MGKKNTLLQIQAYIDSDFIIWEYANDFDLLVSAISIITFRRVATRG